MTLTPGEWRRLHVLTLASMGPGGSTSTSGSSPPPRPRRTPASSGPGNGDDPPGAPNGGAQGGGGHFHRPVRRTYSLTYDRPEVGRRGAGVSLPGEA